MSKFREVKTLQKFASIRASIHNHFNIDRQLYRGEILNEINQLPWRNDVSWRHKARIGQKFVG
jgi:hypothetical protein